MLINSKYQFQKFIVKSNSYLFTQSNYIAIVKVPTSKLYTKSILKDLTQ